MPKLVKVQKDGAEGFVPEGALEHWKKKGYEPVADPTAGGQVAAPAAVEVVTDPGDGQDDGPDPDPTETPEPDPGDGGTAAGSADVSDKDQSPGGRRGLLGR